MTLFLIAPKWIKMFVLDEADEMLSRGFKDQIYEIFQKLNTSIQVSFYIFLKPEIRFIQILLKLKCFIVVSPV